MGIFPESWEDSGSFKPLERTRTYGIDFEIQLPDGPSVTRHLLVRGGDRVQLLVLAPHLTRPELVVQTGQTGPVYGVAFSTDGQHILTGSQDTTAILWDARTGDKLRTFTRHTSSVTSVAVSGEGRRVFTGSYDGTTRIWDVATGDELCRLILLDGGVDWLVVTPEGLFNGTPGGREKVMYRVGEGLEVVPVDRFYQDFKFPGLLAAIRRGERLMPSVELGTSRPPRLALISPRELESADTPELLMEVSATDQGGGISGPWLRQNGARLNVAGEKRVEGKTVYQTFRIRLVEGENALRVEAASADGSWESEPLKFSLTYRGTQEKPDLYVLVVGINEYAYKTLNLKYARQDAEALAELFRTRGKTLYRNVHVIELLDQKATKKGIKEAFATMARTAQPQDSLVILLSGHGFTRGSLFYFLPHEFEHKSPRFEDDVKQFGLPIDDLEQQINSVKALRRILILDACNSGSAIAQSGGQGKSGAAFAGAIETLNRSTGAFTIAASAADEETSEIRELEHGVLTYTLLAALRGVSEGPLAEKPLQVNSADGVVGVYDWFSYATGEVPRLTKQYLGKAQDVKTSGAGTSFPVLPSE